MRIAILTTGRFHVCDLARELDALGHDVAFYSLVPPWRTRQFGLPAKCNRWLLPWVAPAFLAARAARGTRMEVVTDDALLAATDSAASILVGRCDVTISMSGMFQRTMSRCRSRYGATLLVERGSRHILSQRAILEAIPGRAPGTPVPDSHVRRELASYEMADRIVVPSAHVVESFREQGVAQSRLFRNPYGTDLALFPSTPMPSGDPTILMVGTWSLQKGCDVLAEAWKRVGECRLMHVGPLGDAPIPKSERWEHHGPVEQRRLTDFYAQAHVFSLASRQEGFGVVLPQALASGLPVVCTDRTGGADIRNLLGVGSERIAVVPTEDPEALARSLEEHLRGRYSSSRVEGLENGERAKLSWSQYGARCDQFLNELKR